MALCHVTAAVLVYRKSSALKNRDSILSDTEDRQFCLEKQPTGELKLKVSHDYYLQVQAQLSMCGKVYCDFVCWTTASIHVERIVS